MCVHTQWTGYSPTQVSMALHCISGCRRYMGCCDGACHDLGHSAEGVRDAHGHGVWQSGFLSHQPLKQQRTKREEFSSQIVHISSWQWKGPGEDWHEHVFLAWEPISGGRLDVDSDFSGLWGAEWEDVPFSFTSSLLFAPPLLNGNKITGCSGEGA